MRHDEVQTVTSLLRAAIARSPATPIGYAQHGRSAFSEDALIAITAQNAIRTLLDIMESDRDLAHLGEALVDADGNPYAPAPDVIANVEAFLAKYWGGRDLRESVSVRGKELLFALLTPKARYEP